MLLPPTITDRRALLGDWFELHAIFSERRMASAGDLANVLDIADDGPSLQALTDPVTGEPLDQEILDETRSGILDAAFAELQYRAECLGESYPFTVDGRNLILRAAFRTDGLHYGQVAYTFCLVTTAIREKMLSGLDSLTNEILELPLHFQVCACVAAGGYFGGSVCSFGFPRAKGDAFLTALKNAYKRFGYGDARTTIKPGLVTSPKDGGIDVIAWKDHPDKLPSKLYSLGQTASGSNWLGKSVTQDVDPFHGDWFAEHPASHYVPALFIPFLAYADLDEFDEETYRDAKATKVASRERRFGLIFDRLRIAHHLNSCMEAEITKRGSIDGTDLMEEVAQWVNVTVGKVIRQGAFA
jgi:hypothetical protein